MIKTKNQMNTNDAPADLHAATLVAFRDATAVRSAESVLAALRALANVENLVDILQTAVLESRESGVSLVEHLRQLEAALREQAEVARTRKNAYKKKCDARHAEVQPVLSRCASELLALSQHVKGVEQRIAGARQEREANKARYEKAGLKQNEIEALGVKPTDADLAAWRQDLELSRARCVKLSAFIASGPDYPEGILADDKVAA